MCWQPQGRSRSTGSGTACESNMTACLTGSCPAGQGSSRPLRRCMVLGSAVWVC
jgi:hypothetical protein